MEMPNWIADVNRFNLEPPTQEFLAGLLSFDAQLVILPSRMHKRYQLCRRRQFSAGIGDVAMLDNKHPDTNMFYAHGVLPIAPLKFKSGTVAWSMQNLEGLIALLRSRDTWAVSGGPTSLVGEKGENTLADHVDAMDREQEAKERRDTKETFYHLGREAYRAIAARTGRRNKRASDYHGAARPKWGMTGVQSGILRKPGQ